MVIQSTIITHQSPDWLIEIAKLQTWEFLPQKLDHPPHPHARPIRPGHFFQIEGRIYAKIL